MPDPQQAQTQAATPPPQQTLAQLIRAKYPNAYNDMDDATLEKNVLAKYPEYSDVPRTETPESQAPNAAAQAHQQMQRAIPIKAAADAASYPGAQPNLSPFTAAGQKQAQIGENYNNYMKQSGETIGQAAGGMATAGVLPFLKGGGFAKNALRFAGRAATSGAAMGGGTLAGGGSPQEAAGAAEGGAIAQPVSEGISAALPWMANSLKNTAVKQFGRALAPTTKINKAITQEIAPEMIQRGIHGSLEGIEKGAGKQIAELDPQLNSAYAQAQGAGKIAGAGDQVISDLENLKQSYMPEGNVAQPQAVHAIEGIQNIVKQYGSDVSPNSLRRLRQIFEDPVAKAGGYAGADLSTNYTLNAQQAAADSIRGILNKTPDIGALNKEISFWLDVQRVTSQSGLRRTGQEGGLLKVLAPLGFGGAASMTGLHYGAQAGVEAGAATALTAMAAQAMRSPAWRTASAVLKDRFATALAQGNVSEVSALLAKLGIANQASQTATPPQNPRLPWLPGQQQPQGATQ